MTQQLKILNRFTYLKYNYASLIVSTDKVNSKRITDLTHETFDTLVLHGDSTNTEILLTCCESSIAVTRQKPSTLLAIYAGKKGVSSVHKLAWSTKKLFITSINKLLTFNSSYLYSIKVKKSHYKLKPHTTFFKRLFKPDHAGKTCRIEHLPLAVNFYETT